MDRVSYSSHGSLIEAGFSMIPKGLHYRLRDVDFFLGSDPIFAGLHNYETADDGRSYRDTTHCVYKFHQTILPKHLRRTTIVIPGESDPLTVVHELGHVLDETVGFNFNFKPISRYAETSKFEAFACLFEQWCVWGDTNYLEATNLFKSLLI